jgi:hypothetical protein
VRCDGEELDRMNGAAAGQARDICGGARAGVARPTRLPIQTIYFGSCYILSVVQRSVFAARLQKFFSPKNALLCYFPPKMHFSVGVSLSIYSTHSHRLRPTRVRPSVCVCSQLETVYSNTLFIFG